MEIYKNQSLRILSIKLLWIMKTTFVVLFIYVPFFTYGSISLNPFFKNDLVLNNLNVCEILLNLPEGINIQDYKQYRP